MTTNFPLEHPQLRSLSEVEAEREEDHSDDEPESCPHLIVNMDDGICIACGEDFNP